MSPSDAQVRAAYYDGLTAVGRIVTLSLEGQTLLLQGSQGEVRWPLREVTVSERLGNTPRLLTFAGGGHCEVSDQGGLDRLLRQAGARSDWLDKLHHSLPWAFASVVLVAVFVAGAYRYLLPWGAEILAARVPDAVLQQMGTSTLKTLDKTMLHPSKLTAERQQQLSDAFARLRSLPGAGQRCRLVFRASPAMGANAFALPDGTLVLLDGLVSLTHDDNELMAVLAHERGHVERRHAMRMLLQSSVVGLVLAWYVGDVSGLLTTLPAVVLQANYSRDMEREADEYAAQTLRLNGESPCKLASILDKLEASHRQREQRHSAATQEAEGAGDYLSSHPATQERMNRLCPDAAGH